MKCRAFRIALNISSGTVIIELLVVCEGVSLPILLVHLADRIDLLQFHSLPQGIHLIADLDGKGLLPVEEVSPAVLEEVLRVFTDGDCIAWHGRMI
jgi:hypothetical protein